MTLEAWTNENENCGLTIPPMSTRDAKDILVEEVLGKDWRISYPCNGEQEMAEIVYSVISEVKRLKTPWWKKLFA